MSIPHKPDDAVNPADILSMAMANTEEDFPVLKAFQQFFEAERERQPKKSRTFLYGALGALAVLVLGVLGFVAIRLGDMDKRAKARDEHFAALLAKATAELEIAPAPIPAPAPAKVDDESDRIAAMMAVLSEMKSSMESMDSAAVARENALKEMLSAETSAREAALKEATDALEKVARESVANLSASGASPPNINIVATQASSSRPSTEAAAIQSSPRTSNASHTHTAAGLTDIPPAVRQMSLPQGYAASEITVQSTDGRSIPWRVLLPELSEEEAVQ